MLFTKCIFKALVSSKPLVKKLIKNKDIGAPQPTKTKQQNLLKLHQKLFPLPPTITITQIKNVYLIGL